MSNIIGGYFCKKLQHWVKVIKPTKDNHTPYIRPKSISRHRMKGSERKQTYCPTIEDNLKQQIIEFLNRNRGESFEKT